MVLLKKSYVYLSESGHFYVLGLPPFRPQAAESTGLAHISGVVEEHLFFFIHITKRSEGQVRDLQPSVSLQKSSELIHPLQPLTHQLLKPLGQQAVGHLQR